MSEEDYIVGDYAEAELELLQEHRIIAAEIEGNRTPTAQHERSRSFSARSSLLHPDLGSASQRSRHRKVASVAHLLEYCDTDASVYMHVSGPPEVPHLAKKSSTVHAAMLFLKSMVGTFVLYLPYLYSTCGIVTGSIILVAVAAISTCNMLLLSRCYDWQRHLGASSYGEIGAAAHGRWGAIAVDVSILLSQLGFCITYMVYLTKNIIQDAGLDAHAGLGYTENNALVILSILTLLLVPLAWVRRIQYLGGLMMVANICVLSGFCATFAYSAFVLDAHGPATVEWQFTTSNGVLLFIGSVAICFEGIGLLVPIKDSMEHPAHFDPMVSVIMVALALLFAGFGIVGYLAFGDDVEYFATLNLPQNGAGIFVRVLYSLAVFLAYPLQLFPAVEILERTLFYWYASEPPGTFKWQKNTLRGLLVAFTAFVALVTGESFDNFVAVIGALCAAPLALIYPPLIHLKLASSSLSMLQRTTEVTVVVIGCCVTLVHT